jgi:Mycoplasma protein of unknown function, DUF285
MDTSCNVRVVACSIYEYVFTKHASCVGVTKTPWQGNISLWDTSNVVEMDDTFAHAIAFDNDLSAWDTSKVRI